MATPLKATFFTLRRRERGGVLFGATIVHVVLLVALAVGFGALNAGYLAQAARGAEPVTSATDPGAVLMVVSAVGFAFFYCVVTASYEAACLRWMIRGETAGFGGFSLGGDTWRVYAGYWIWLAIGLAAVVAVFTFAVLLTAALDLAAAADDEPAWVGWLVIAAWCLVTAPFAIRLSVGNAASIARRKFAYFDGWRVSRDRTRALLGSFTLLWLIWLALWFAIWLGLSFVAYLAMGGAEGDVVPARTNFILSFAAVTALLVANMALALLSAGVNARAVMAAIEDGKLAGVSVDVAKVFD